MADQAPSTSTLATPSPSTDGTRRRSTSSTRTPRRSNRLRKGLKKGLKRYQKVLRYFLMALSIILFLGFIAGLVYLFVFAAPVGLTASAFAVTLVSILASVPATALAAFLIANGTDILRNLFWRFVTYALPDPVVISLFLKDVREDNTNAVERWLRIEEELIFAQDHHGRTALMMALWPYRSPYDLADEDDLKQYSPRPLQVKTLLGRGAKVRLEVSRGEIPPIDRHGNTVMIYAARAGLVRPLERILGAGGDTVINVANERGDTPLMIAARYNQAGVLDKLLSVPGVNIHLKNRRGTENAEGKPIISPTLDGITALAQAAEHDAYETVVVMLQKPTIEWRKSEIREAFLKAVAHASAEVIELFLESSRYAPFLPQPASCVALAQLNEKLSGNQLASLLASCPGRDWLQAAQRQQRERQQAAAEARTRQYTEASPRIRRRRAMVR